MHYSHDIPIVIRDKVRAAMKGGGSDFYGYDHIDRVAIMARTDDEYVVAICHDVVEDGFATFSDLEFWGVTELQLHALQLLCRDDTMSYDAYVGLMIDLAAYSDTQEHARLALTIKTYDIFDHLSPHRNDDEGRQLSFRAAMRYTTALQRIMYARADLKF
jgi:hypothetical protein